MSLQTSKKWMDITVESLTRSKLSLILCLTHQILWKGSDLAASIALDLTVATILSQAGKFAACKARKEARVWP